MTALAGTVAGEAVPRRIVDERISALRAGPHAAALPAVGTAEDRQLARWVGQVVLVERLCLAEARRMGLPIGGSTGPLDRRDAVELGSITAAAYAGSQAVRAVYAAVTADVQVGEAEVRRLFGYRAAEFARPARWVLRHALFDTEAEAEAADPRWLPPLGEVSTAELPAALARAVAHRRAGATVGPLRDALGWHLAYVEAALPPIAADFAVAAPKLRAELRAAAQRRTFAHWLDRRRAELVVPAPGMEHPADPAQPDHRHRH
jgi:[acyl-carrier-protein] S-malonyltransferase